MPTIAHISDLHLQSGVPERQAQVEPILQKINEMKPDLVVISGDVTDDGWDSIEELKWAKDWLGERINGDWFAVPGNHDVGNFVNQKAGQIDDTRVRDWELVFDGVAEFTKWKGHREDDKLFCWQIYGFNSMLLGSSGKYEALQAEWFTEPLILPRPIPEDSEWVNRSKRISYYRVAFIHSPLFVHQINEEQRNETDYWLGPETGRARFFEQLKRFDFSFIGSGHVHQTRLTEADGVKIAWAPPASGTWVHAPGLPNPPMPQQTGFFLHTLHDDGRVDSELIACAPMLKLYEHNP